MSEYRPFDREEKLGPPPWKSDDPKLVAWEQAHGHDVRLKCFPEFGCQVIQERAEEIEEAAREVVQATSAVGIDTNQGRIGDSLRALVEALDG